MVDATVQAKEKQPAQSPTGARADVGGVVADANGYFYKGGQFLPTTSAEPGKWKIGKKWVRSGRELVEPGVFAHQPTPFSRSIFTVIHVLCESAGGALSVREGIRDHTGLPITSNTPMQIGVRGHMGAQEPTLQELIVAFNGGQRWFDVKPEEVTLTTQAEVVTHLAPRTREASLSELGPEPKPITPGAPPALSFHAYLDWNRRKEAAKIAAIGDVGDIAIVKHDQDDRWKMILRDASEPGKWRTQTFDKHGFSGHHGCNTKDEAIADAASGWFILRDDAALDRLQDTAEFQLGLYAAELIQRMNVGEINYAQMNQMLIERQAQDNT